MANHGGTWGWEELNHFLYKPRDYVEGTKMSFGGLKKAEDRAAVIAWLNSKSDNPLPYPDPAEATAAEGTDAAADAAADTPAEAAESNDAPAEEAPAADAPAEPAAEGEAPAQ